MNVDNTSNSKRNRNKLKRVCQCAGDHLGCGSMVVLEMRNNVFEFPGYSFRRGGRTLLLQHICVLDLFFSGIVALMYLFLIRNCRSAFSIYVYLP